MMSKCWSLTTPASSKCRVSTLTQEINAQVFYREKWYVDEMLSAVRVLLS